jgi:chromosome segregation ATPase
MANQGSEDEGLQKFRDLVAALTRTNNTMDQHNKSLDTESEKLSDLEGTAEKRLDDVEEALEKDKDDLDTAADEAVEEIDDLVGVAHEGATDTLADAIKDIDAAEARFGTALKSAGDDLDEGHADLKDRGFSALASDLDVVEQVLQQADKDMDTSGNTFEKAVHTDGAEVDKELDETEGKVNQAAGETRRELEEVKAKAGEHAESFDGMATALAAACETVFGDVEGDYGDLDGDVRDDVKGMVESIRKSAKEEADEIEEEVGTQMTQPTATIVDTDVPTFLAQADVAEAAVKGVIATGAEMEKTVDNLLVCKEVCDVIKDTLAAMGPG